MELKKYVSFVFILIFSLNGISSNSQCVAKKIQVMKPLFPAVNISGYSIIEFDVDTEGSIVSPRSIETKCLLNIRGSDEKEFRDCGAFIYESIAASRYIKYSRPTDSQNKECKLKNQQHKFTFIRSKKDSSYFSAVSEYSNDLLRQNELVDVTPLKTPGSLERKK